MIYLTISINFELFICSYQMMYNKEIAEIPIQNFLNSQGLVVVWCTNSLAHIKSVKEEMFPAWNVTFKASWYWLKVKY